MTCDICQRIMNYCFYINDEHWLKVVGKKEGHRCAHCILEALGDRDWYIIHNEAAAKIGREFIQFSYDVNKDNLPCQKFPRYNTCNGNHNIDEECSDSCDHTPRCKKGQCK